MLQSWHNFFFVAAEPGGAVSVDKPPVGLWIQVISASFLGVNALGLLLPQILAGVLSVILLYFLVRRSFGQMAGALAALALALTPVAVATDRNNTMDSTLILTLLVAAWAFLKATETGKLRYLLLGSLLVGIGFNIKMLEAYLPLPAFLALYLLGSQQTLWRKAANLLLAGVVIGAVSLSWALAVDLTPQDNRPYVGSSGNNSVMSLALGYNGVERLLGMGGRGGILTAIFDGGQARAPGPAQRAVPQAPLPRNPDGPPQPDSTRGNVPQPSAFGPGATPARPQRVDGFPGGGFGATSGTGQAGPLRLFAPPLSKEVSWLLPIAILGLLLLALGARLRWPILPKHQSLALWGGWLLVGAIFFSVAGFFHEYYLSILAPPVSALFAIAVAQLLETRQAVPLARLLAISWGLDPHPGISTSHCSSVCAHDPVDTFALCACAHRAGNASHRHYSQTQPCCLGLWPHRCCDADHTRHLVSAHYA
ncbi:MAG: glycosyltransferase family 39 protein [Candidatus Bilamarchaeaceae archaeon]